MRRGEALRSAKGSFAALRMLVNEAPTDGAVHREERVILFKSDLHKNWN
jgi:hypothetical protein